MHNLTVLRLLFAALHIIGAISVCVSVPQGCSQLLRVHGSVCFIKSAMEKISVLLFSSLLGALSLSSRRHEITPKWLKHKPTTNLTVLLSADFIPY